MEKGRLLVALIGGCGPGEVGTSATSWLREHIWLSMIGPQLEGGDKH